MADHGKLAEISTVAQSFQCLELLISSKHATETKTTAEEAKEEVTAIDEAKEEMPG